MKLSLSGTGRLLFGKHAGRSLKELMNSKEGLEYVRWLANSTSFAQKDVKKAAKQALIEAKL